MIIQHNMPAIFTRRQLGITEKGKADAANKLASGYKVNKAADNAAGLSISEKMRAQIRGLDRAVVNCEDGISLINVADAGMAEMQAILQRIRELTVQAANDTNVEADRQAISAEIAQLAGEVDHIGNDTEFNTIKVLQGAASGVGEIEKSTITVVDYENHSEVPNYTGLNCNTKYYMSAQDITLDNGTVVSANAAADSTGSSHYSYGLSFAQVDSAEKWKKLDEAGFTFKCTLGCGQEFTFRFDSSKVGITDETPSAVIEYGGTENNKVFCVGTKNYSSGADFVSELVAFVDSVDPSATGDYVGHDNRIGVANGGNDIIIYGTSYGSGDTGYLIVGRPVVKEVEVDNFIANDEMAIQVGANTGQAVRFPLPHLDADTLQMDNIDVMSYNTATKSLTAIDEMIEKVSEERSRLGAVSNRLEHACRNAANMSENLQNAESKIRDADMAEEMVELSKLNILEQAGQAVLTQQNQATQGVLKLLQ